MEDKTRFDVHAAATKAEILAFNLKNASGLACLLDDILDSKIGGTIEGQSLVALITLLDKLQEDCSGLSDDLYALHRGMKSEGSTTCSRER